MSKKVVSEPVNLEISANEENRIGENIVRDARKVLGSKYRSGGEKPGAFDCSGLVKWAAGRSGITLPRLAREQMLAGVLVESRKDLRPGDIVAFKPKRGYHVGIYVGDGNFIHSSPKYNSVRYSRLDNSYFNQIYIGARRIGY